MDTVSDTDTTAAGAGLLERFESADFPWYGLDEGWEGRRWLSSVCAGADGVEYGTLGHGEHPSRRPGVPEPRRFVCVLTLPRRGCRPSGDGTGQLEATTCATAASLAGVALLADSLPWGLDRELRQQWLHQQTNLTWELADNLTGDGWDDLTLPVDTLPLRFRYRESEYGWVLAGETSQVYLGAYGRGVSAYGLGLTRLPSLDGYHDPGGREALAIR